ncbi:type VII secretion protein EssA [Rossellomorea vietnamensis]|uniref:type VII secretion protein EssA n=1 Tax=Rossellomorea vietnamensis TaxID=218284 RepID=UPI00308E33F8|nr:type VII secretion protein EssA [Rossellomorea vietnamensis]
MRGKILLLLTCIVSVMMLFGSPIFAGTNINELIPNDYQENKFKKNSDLIHDQSSTNQKIKIPDEQKSLTFEGRPSNGLNELKDKIFYSEEKDTNTIKAKAVNLKLFSQSESARLGGLEEDSQSSSSLSLLIAIFVGICVLLLIAVIVIWNRTAQRKQGLK